MNFTDTTVSAATASLNAYATATGLHDDPDAAATDLICDLLHLVRRRGGDWPTVLARAVSRHAAEDAAHTAGRPNAVLTYPQLRRLLPRGERVRIESDLGRAAADILTITAVW